MRLTSRKSPAHGIFTTRDHPTIVFLTVCTQARGCWLTSQGVHETLRIVWREAWTWRVGRYVLMPDHIHLFCSPVELEVSLGRWIHFWKSRYSRRDPRPDHLWQRGYWDTRLRREDGYAQKWDYVRYNPVRAGLVKQPEEWPFQGEIDLLDW